MRDPYDPQRLEQANSILATFLPNSRLYIAQADTTRPYVIIETTLDQDGPDVVKVHRQPAIPNTNASGLSIGPGGLRFGGTAEEGIACLIRFVRGRTRRPMQWWADRFPAKTFDTLWSTSYPVDVEKMACVLCGEPTKSHDWSRVNRWTTGPCCALGACRGDRVSNGRAMPVDALAGAPGPSGGVWDDIDRMVYRGVVHNRAGEATP